MPRLIRRARWDAHFTQRQLAERAGISRFALSHYETGRRTPPLATLRTILAAAGKQVHADLEPLDADIKQAITELSAQPVDDRPGTRMWCELDPTGALAYRVEGLAAASILGAPIPVESIEIALADDDTTYAWLSEIMMNWTGRLRAPDWPTHRVLQLPPDRLRTVIHDECAGSRFDLRCGAFDASARLAPRNEIANHVRVVTSRGTILVQPFHEIEASDARAARVLSVLRDEQPGREAAPPGTALQPLPRPPTDAFDSWLSGGLDAAADDEAS